MGLLDAGDGVSHASPHPRMLRCAAVDPYWALSAMSPST